MTIFLDTPPRRCDIRCMPLQLERPEDYVKLTGLAHGLSWICVACLTVNRPSVIDCDGCGKQRWSQLHVSHHDAVEMAKEIK